MASSALRTSPAPATGRTTHGTTRRGLRTWHHSSSERDDLGEPAAASSAAEGNRNMYSSHNGVASSPSLPPVAPPAPRETEIGPQSQGRFGSDAAPTGSTLRNNTHPTAFNALSSPCGTLRRTSLQRAVDADGAMEEVMNQNDRRTRRRILSNAGGVQRALPNTEMYASMEDVDSGTVTLSVECFNEMKRDIDRYKRVTNDLCSSIEVWKAKCESFEEAAKSAKITAEYISHTPSSSASRSSSIMATPPGGKKVSVLKSALFNDLSLKKIPYPLTTHFSSLFDEMTRYAHMYTSEVCMASWSSLHSTLIWPPNEVIQEDRRIRDWRGRCVKVNEFKPEIVDKNGDLRFIGAPLLDISPMSEDVPDGKVIIKSAFLPLCPHEEAARGTMFSSSQDMKENFIGQCVLSVINEAMVTRPSEEMQALAYRLASESDILKKRFEVVCRQVLSGRKKHTKDIYFSTLGYASLSAPKSRTFDNGNSATRDNEEREAYSRLHRLRPDGTRDTSFWRMASFAEICSETLNSVPSELEHANDVDVLFGNKAARLTYRQFRKYPIDGGDETSVLSIIRLDALMTSVIDNFASRTYTPCTTDITHDLSADCADDIETNKKCWRGVKGGTIPLDVIRRFRSLLPLASSQFHCTVLDTIKDVLSKEGFPADLELGVQHDGSLNSRLYNCKREFTLAFRYPPNGRYYIAVTQDAFSRYVCSWVGSVNDCYILQSPSLDANFTPFDGQASLDMVESDDELPETLIPLARVSSSDRVLSFDDEEVEDHEIL